MPTAEWTTGQSGPLHVAVLFMDLVSSTDVASVTDLERYAEFSREFQATCREQCHYYFAERIKDRYRTDGTRCYRAPGWGKGKYHSPGTCRGKRKNTTELMNDEG